ncbi:flagellar biosynthesis anti-sigma factor FlgM [Massilia niastensis]|uniref:flagellar biosynthesis anti-sigma factor FlgM n=1 Tax=Massilia niastensis TaxID=544911 RepID=UPI000476C372|nr:flagellar biosynthesis anti-sigma factor FlgM [Massilia niastensis]
MKITGSPVSTVTPGAQPASAPAQPAPAGAPAAALQSEVLKPASEALRALPDFDAARVAELRDALARGELPFDPARLAGLIQKFHGSR